MKLVCNPADLGQLGDRASQFEIVPDESPLSSELDKEEFFLRFEDGILRLCRGDDDQGVWVDPLEIGRRLKGDFLLGRACGVRRGVCLEILDATAGLGVDGLALWKRGQRLHLVEREPVLGALLGNLLERLGAGEVELTLSDSAALLNEARCYDVIFLDPMFAARRKAALPGKRMQYLSALLAGSEEFDAALIPLARSRARNRVVLKRRARDPVTLKPDWSIRGRAVRYDVYRGSGVSVREAGPSGTPD